MVLGRDVYQAIVQVLGKDAGELFVKAVEKALTEIEEGIKNQKHTLKAQLKDELTKELITKEEFYGKIEVLYEHIERVKEEILRYVDTKFALLMQEIEKVRAENREGILELKQEMEKMRGEAKQDTESVRSELRQEAERGRIEAKEDNVKLGETLRKEMAELEKRLMQEIRRVETELRVEIEAIKDRLFILEKRFDRLELYMRVLLVLVLLGLTLLNPTFFEILKTIFGLK